MEEKSKFKLIDDLKKLVEGCLEEAEQLHNVAGGYPEADIKIVLRALQLYRVALRIRSYVYSHSVEFLKPYGVKVETVFFSVLRENCQAEIIKLQSTLNRGEEEYGVWQSIVKELNRLEQFYKDWE